MIGSLLRQQAKLVERRKAIVTQKTAKFKNKNRNNREIKMYVDKGLMTRFRIEGIEFYPIAKHKGLPSEMLISHQFFYYTLRIFSSTCNMCHVDVYGFNSAADHKIHRKSYSHHMLREFLHPKCTPCQKEFQVRGDWDAHKFTASHLKNLANEGIIEVAILTNSALNRFDWTLIHILDVP